MDARHLVFISGTPANVRQGSGTFVGIAALRLALEAMGHEVELVAPEEASPAAWRRLWFNLQLRRRRWGAGTLVVGFDWDGIFLPAAQVASIKGVLGEEMQWERGLPRARLWAQSRLERARTQHARRVLATSNYAAQALTRRYGIEAAKIRVVPELLDVAAWQQALAAAPAPREEQLRAAATVLCVAHLYPRKDAPTLLRAMALLPSAAIVQLRVVGTGPEERRWRRMAVRLGLGERVVFLGHISRAELAREYRHADIFCLPSRQEGFGIVLLEAMAAGLPVVAARAAAIPEVVPEPACGRLFPPGDAVALAATLRLLLDDAPMRHALGAAGARHVWRFDARAVALAFLHAVQD